MRLVGGIGTGKSTVSGLFRLMASPSSPADALKKGSGGWKKVVVVAFGDEIMEKLIGPNLAKLYFLILQSAGFLIGLFWDVFNLWIKGCKIIILDIPLLFEAKMDTWTKPIIVVWVDPDTQLYRLMNRDGTSEEDAKNRINSLMPLDIKRRKADIVIDNNGSLEDSNENFMKVLAQVTKPTDMD